MSHTDVRVRIDELVITGHGNVDRAGLAVAVQSELTRLLSRHSRDISTESRARVDAGTIRPTQSTHVLGKRIAHATFNTLRGRQ